MTTGRRVTAAILCWLFLLAVLDVPVFAQQAFSSSDYRVGEGDRIFLSVPARPDLNRELVIEAGGIVNLPLIGDVPVAGLTVDEIEKKTRLDFFSELPKDMQEKLEAEAAKGMW